MHQLLVAAGGVLRC